MVYLWKIPNDWSEKLIGEYVKTDSIDRFELTQGKEVASSAQVVIRFECPKADLDGIDDLPNTAMVPVVSPRLADVLKAHAPEEYQLINASVITLDGSLDGYNAVVATRSIAIMDREKSEFTTVPGTNAVMGIQHLVCRNEGLDGLSLARDTEYLSNLFVSDELRSAILRLEPRGMALYTPADLVR